MHSLRSYPARIYPGALMALTWWTHCLSAQPAPGPSGGLPAGLPGTAGGPDIHDIHGPVALTFWEQYGTQIMVGTIVGGLLLALVVWWLRRQKPEIPLTPLERARLAIAAARVLMLTAQDKAFAITVSDAVRQYLEEAYQMPAPERTTEEFLQQAAGHTLFQGELTGLLRRFLELCDLAKFAGQQFGDAEREQLLAAASNFVETADKLRQPPDAKNPPAKPASASPVEVKKETSLAPSLSK